MRVSRLLLTSLVLLPCGCASWIARSGDDISYLSTRDQVRHRFGEPERFGVQNGRTYEEFSTRDKISEEGRAAAVGMDVAMTYGAGEVVALPVELYRQGERVIVGQTIRFEYDVDGKVVDTLIDGYPTQDHAPIQVGLPSVPSNEGFGQGRSPMPAGPLPGEPGFPPTPGAGSGEFIGPGDGWAAPEGNFPPPPPAASPPRSSGNPRPEW